MGFKVSRRALVAGMAVAPFVPGIAFAKEIVGKITRFDPALDALIDVSAPIEVIAKGYRWAEGPVWVKAGGYLLFSDVPSNLVWQWKPGKAAVKFLEPSGLAGPIPAAIREAGANGLAIDAKGNLIIADSGNRCISSLDLKTRQRTVLADRYDGKRFNSCNDVAVHRNGTIYFTDPPYGLAEGDTSPLKELRNNGVYRLTPSGEVHAVDDTLSRPNGVGVSPDHQTLYVSMSDEKRPHILAYPIDVEGAVSGEPNIFADFSAELAQKLPGLPDGLKVAKSGHLFASGPGGIYVLSPEGKKLGLIATGKGIANCAFGEDGRTLFLTSGDMVAKVRLKQSGW